MAMRRQPAPVGGPWPIVLLAVAVLVVFVLLI
jgi:hypothetical protein